AADDLEPDGLKEVRTGRLAIGRRSPWPTSISAYDRTVNCTIVQVRLYARPMTNTSPPPGASSTLSRDYFAGDSRSNYERMVAGDFYISDDPKIFEEQQRATRLSAMFLAAYTDDGVAAQEIARELFGSFGEAAYVRPPVYVDYGSHITV